MFKIGMLMMAPDGDPEIHRATLCTGAMEYTLVAIEGGNIDQAVAVCRELAENNGVDSIFLCPGFNYSAVARVKEAVGENVALNTTSADLENFQVALRLLAAQGIVH